MLIAFKDTMQERKYQNLKFLFVILDYKSAI